MMLSEMLSKQEPFGIAEAVTRQLTRDDPPARTGVKEDGKGLKFSTPQPMSLTERTVPADLRTKAGLEETE
jgi:Rod binding domain-containing protein